MMGSGKSTIGRLLAARTGWPYLDNDELVERARGTTARELLAEAGEAELREAEMEALRHGLSEPAPCIMGAAGGTVLDAANRELMRDESIVVWLTASAETLATRASGADHRPWLESDPVGWVTATLEERRPLYESVADLTVATDLQTPESAVSEIVDWLAASASCGEWLDG
jgi:shikimate kinase